MTRILIAHPSTDLYGSDQMLLETIQGLTAAGMEPLVVLPSAGPLLTKLDESNRDYRLEHFPVLRKSLLRPQALFRSTLQLLPTIRVVRNLLRELRPQALFVNTLTLPHWLVAARMSRIPSLCHVHEAEAQLPGWLSRILVRPLSLANRVVANSRFTANYLQRHGHGLTSKTVVVTNGIAFESQPRPLPPRDGPWRLLVLGRLSPRKGQLLALEALARLIDMNYQVCLEIVGSAFQGYEWYEELLHDRTATLGIRDKVSFRRFCDPPWQAYADAHVVLVPSEMESFGNVAVQAMSVGRPVVVSNAGALSEIVEHGITGLVFESGNLLELTSAILQIINNYQGASKMAARASPYVRTHFAPDRYRMEIASAVMTLLDGANSELENRSTPTMDLNQE